MDPQPDLVRPVRPGDLSRLTAIYAHHVMTGAASFELEPPTLAEMQRRHETILAGGYPYLVAERAGRIDGYAYASVYRTRPAYRFTVENSVYVDAAAVRSGIGKRLLDALVDACAARGFRQMIAVIGDSANEGSIGLHVACGFERIGTLPAVGWKFGRWVDSILMQRALGAGALTPPDDRLPGSSG